ncbi:MAG: NAD(P)H-binding protein [Bacteroidia bacterium]
MITKKIALFGTNESLVRRVAEEALIRGHRVTAIVSKLNELKLKHIRFNAFSGEILKPEVVEKYAKGHDAVICLDEPTISHPGKHIEANRSVLEGAKCAGVQRIVSLGHPITQNYEKSKAFHDLWKFLIGAQKETLNLFKNEFWFRWLYLHSVELNPGQKEIKYSVSNQIYLSNPEIKDKIVDKNKIIQALLEEAEKNEYILEEAEIELL